MRTFAERVIAWQRVHGRHDLPWQGTRDPYRVWLSEIMLQQTQVAAVIPYYRRFLDRFPDIAALAAADQEAVMTLWSGLGYYARARNLHRAAQAVVTAHGGHFPAHFDAIAALPGIGRSTAGAIAVFAFGARHPILDGNVKRVFARCFGIDGFPGLRQVEQRLWTLAEALLPQDDLPAYTQGLMDLGAGLCGRTRPQCSACPLQQICVARQEDRIASLPAPRPRKAVPEKSTRMLILVLRGEVFLEKRPAPGIWGGLWSFPEAEAGQDPAAICRSRFGADVETDRILPDVRHGFTHFTLNITPVLLRVARLEPRAGAPDGIWLNLEDATDAALPAPVRRILQQLCHV